MRRSRSPRTGSMKDQARRPRDGRPGSAARPDDRPPPCRPGRCSGVETLEIMIGSARRHTRRCHSGVPKGRAIGSIRESEVTERSGRGAGSGNRPATGPASPGGDQGCPGRRRGGAAGSAAVTRQDRPDLESFGRDSPCCRLARQRGADRLDPGRIWSGECAAKSQLGRHPGPAAHGRWRRPGRWRGKHGIATCPVDPLHGTGPARPGPPARPGRNWGRSCGRKGVGPALTTYRRQPSAGARSTAARWAEDHVPPDRARRNRELVGPWHSRPNRRRVQIWWRCRLPPGRTARS